MSLPSEEALAPAQVSGLAARGAAMLGGRAVLIYGLGIAANLVLARLLVPSDFGIVALGTVVLVLGAGLAESGFGAALVRRERPPERIELEAVLGLQLAFTIGVAALVAAALVPLGDDGLVIAIMVASLPVRVLRLPAGIVLERRLDYRAIASADLVEAVAYYAWALTTVLLGAGVWGLATAAVVRSLAGALAMWRLGPLGLPRPRWSWRHVRPLLGFGARIQGTVLLQVGREQGVNVAVAAVGGIAALGVWNLAWRVLQVPAMIFNVVGRLAFPVMSRVVAAGDDPRPIIERGLGLCAVITGMVAVALAGVAPALPEVIGSGWGDVPRVVLWSAVALLVSAPTTLGTTGYLMARDEAGAVAFATIVSAAVWIAITIAFVPEHGAPAAAVGWIGGGIAAAFLLGRRTGRLVGSRLITRLAGPTLAAGASMAAASAIAHRPSDGLLGGIVGIGVGELVLLALLALVSRPALRDAVRLARRALVAGDPRPV